MDFQALMNYVKEEDLTGDIAEFAEIFGIEATLRLLYEFGGMSLWVPKGVFNDIIYRFIVDNYNGHNTKELAKKFNYTCRYVKSIVSKGRNS